MRETPQQAEVRKFSRAVFGNRHKLEVLGAIAEGDSLFYIQSVADTTGIPSSTVRPIAKDLVGLLVEELPAVGGATAPHYHERLEHPIWQMAADLLGVVRQHHSGSSSVPTEVATPGESR